MKILQILSARRLLGNRGERDACRYLRRHGYRILKRNFVSDGGEIDIVAQCKEATVFVEVKTRTLEAQGAMESRPAAAVTPKKQQKILHTALYFKRDRNKPMRFDIIEVIYTKDNPKKPLRVTHMVSAFNYDTAYRRSK